MKGILRPRNYLKIPSVKVIPVVKKIAYKSLEKAKKGDFKAIFEDGQSKSRY